ARDDRDALQAAEAVRADRGVEGGGDDPLVFRQQVVRELMEVRDSADHGSARDDVIALGRQLCEQLDVLGVTLDQPVARIGVEAALDRPVLAEVVDADHVVARLQQLGDKVAAYETCRSGDENFQSRIGPMMPQMSTTSRPSSSSSRYARWGAPNT